MLLDFRIAFRLDIYKGKCLYFISFRLPSNTLRMYVKEMQRVMHGDEDTRVHWAMTDEVTTR